MSGAHRFCLLSCLGVALLLTSPAAYSAPPPKTQPLQTFVQSALENEIAGDNQERRELLISALKADADYAPARWQLGQLKYQDKWQDYRKVPALEAKRPEVQQYRKLRQPLPNSAGDHLKIADWCRDHGLPLQEQVHLIAALELSNNPNDVNLRARLGHQFVDGAWMTPTEIVENVEAAERIEAAAKTWRPKLEILKRQLESPRTELQEKARQELLAIDDPDVLPALEAAFSEASLKTAEELVDLLSQIKLVEADRYLARQAVLSPYVTVREAAADALRSRPPESYVPVLIESLHTPIQSQVRLYVGRSGVRLTHLLSSEMKDLRQVVGRDLQIAFRHLPMVVTVRPLRGELPGIPLEHYQRSQSNRMLEADLLRTQLQAYAQQRVVDAKNDRLKDWNDRIFAALEKSTGSDLPHDPKDWWKWWEDYNQVFTPDEKPVEYVLVTDRREEVKHYADIRISMSCLTAGTPIWTDQGFLPVEKVQVGDLVLSQHSRTGELAYQPVLKTTVRPATELVTVRFDNSQFSCTLGHTFWISGKGWQKIRDLPSGTLFHTPSGAAKLDILAKANPLPTHNLVVADFHTYFVGQNMVLSHDPTFAEPLNNPVPGWPE